MILQEDTSRNLSNLSEAVKTGSYKGSIKEYTWDINDSDLPKDITTEDFKEWPNGHCKHVYVEECEEARKHMSNWAMRNTNNHNVNILKKSCLGVLVCTARCKSETGSGVHLRPAICDKARRKQLGKPCPNVRCSGRLELLACRGHGGYPVTHFWRHIHGRIFFQAKGEHDHPCPEAKSSAEARRQRYAVKENRAALISRTKDRKRMLSQDAGTSAISVKSEATTACDQFSHVPKVRRVCAVCLPYDCHCGETIGSYAAADVLHQSLFKSGKEGAVADNYEFPPANLYYTYPYNYTYDEKASSEHYQLASYDAAQWATYPYHSISPEAGQPQSQELPTTTNSHNQYYVDNHYKYSQPYTPCMYDSQFFDYRSTEGESIPTTTTSNSLAGYNYNSDPQLSPPVGDTFTNLHRPNSCHATTTTSQSLTNADAHAQSDLHGNRSPCSNSPTSQAPNYLVSDSVISNDSSLVSDIKPFSEISVSNRSFQLPAIVAAVGNPEPCEIYRTLTDSNSPQPEYIQTHFQS